MTVKYLEGKVFSLQLTVEHDSGESKYCFFNFFNLNVISGLKATHAKWLAMTNSFISGLILSKGSSQMIVKPYPLHKQVWEFHLEGVSTGIYLHICICIYLHSINLYKDVETVIITICNLHMV